MPMQKSMLVNNSYIFEQTFILTKQLCCAVCPLVKCKRLEESHKASRIYGR